jgi:hypothetical protein
MDQKHGGTGLGGYEPSLLPASLVLSTLLIDSFVGSIPRGIGLISELILDVYHCRSTHC